MLKFIFWGIFAFLSELLTYKFIKKLDQKERTKLQKKELDYFKILKEKYDDINSDSN